MTEFENNGFFDPETDEMIIAINRLKPITKSGETICSSKNFWNEPLYFHEQVIVSVWVSLLEKFHQDALYEQDIKDYFNIINWIYSLKFTQVLAEKPKERKIDPQLLSEESKTLICEQLMFYVEEENFIKGKNWEKVFIALVGKHVQALQDLCKFNLLKAGKLFSKELVSRGNRG